MTLQRWNSEEGRAIFQAYKIQVADNTLERQAFDLALFERFLNEHHVNAVDLFNSPQAWRDVTWKAVQAFLMWMLSQGYAIGSVNVRLATIKRYASLAYQASVIDAEALNLIRTVRGYRNAHNVDKRRTVTRIGAKKAQSVSLSKTQRRALKRRVNFTPQGACYTLLMCLLLDHGMRVSEVVDLEWDCINFESQTITFYRKKVNRTDTHKLTQNTYYAALDYRPFIIEGEKLIRPSRRGGKLVDRGGITRSAAEQIVKKLGAAIGIPNLSPHDCRHSWATEYKNKHDVFQLRDAGGWSSLMMPNRYVDRGKVSHDGSSVDDD